jgi:hypothetical protein
LITEQFSGIAPEINMASNPTESSSGARGGIERRRHSRHRFIVDLNISSENGASMHGMSFEIGAGGMSAATSGPLEVGEQVIFIPGNKDSREGYCAPKERLNVWL